MAKSDTDSNPFGWLVLGFICGVLATLGALIAFSGGLDETSETPAASRADAAFGATEEAPVADAPPRRIPTVAVPADEAPPPVVTRPPVVTPTIAPPRVRPPPVDDPQIAEDAAASGMTARSPRQ